MCIYDRYQEEKEKREKVREINQAEWEDLIMQLTETHERLNELEERVGHSELTIERLEHSEDKEYLESIEHCKKCRKLGINDEECRNYNNCKTKKFYKDIEKDLEERQSIYDETCKRCSQFDIMTNECCVNANCKDEYLTPKGTCENCKWCRVDFSANLIRHYCDNNLSKHYRVSKDFTCNLWGEKLKAEKTKQDEDKNKVWIVHRTLRKLNKEVYISKIEHDYDTEEDSYLVAHNCGDVFDGYGENIFSCKYEELAYKFNLSTALRVRDLLNKTRIGKRFLWVVSKVRE